LGARFAVPEEGSAVLAPLHQLGVRADYELVPGWNLYARLDNLLSSTWEEWAGYPQRTFSALAGLRVTF
jgi:outer membrane cobalamin receptor